MTEIEKMIFAAAYAHDFTRRIDAGVMESYRQRKPPFKNEGEMIAKWESDSASRSIVFAHGAVELYRQERTKEDP